MSISVALRPAVAVGVVVHPLTILWQISPGKETIQNLREAISSWDQHVISNESIQAVQEVSCSGFHAVPPRFPIQEGDSHSLSCVF